LARQRLWRRLSIRQQGRYMNRALGQCIVQEHEPRSLSDPNP
jgi:hypothetical protein